jgi:hypothetical protein
MQRIHEAEKSLLQFKKECKNTIKELKRIIHKGISIKKFHSYLVRYLEFPACLQLFSESKREFRNVLEVFYRYALKVYEILEDNLTIIHSALLIPMEAIETILDNVIPNYYFTIKDYQRLSSQLHSQSNYQSFSKLLGIVLDFMICISSDIADRLKPPFILLSQAQHQQTTSSKISDHNNLSMLISSILQPTSTSTVTSSSPSIPVPIISSDLHINKSEQFQSSYIVSSQQDDDIMVLSAVIENILLTPSYDIKKQNDSKDSLSTNLLNASAETVEEEQCLETLPPLESNDVLYITLTSSQTVDSMIQRTIYYSNLLFDIDCFCIVLNNPSVVLESLLLQGSERFSKRFHYQHSPYQTKFHHCHFICINLLFEFCNSIFLSYYQLSHMVKKPRLLELIAHGVMIVATDVISTG